MRRKTALWCLLGSVVLGSSTGVAVHLLSGTPAHQTTRGQDPLQDASSGQGNSGLNQGDSGHSITLVGSVIGRISPTTPATLSLTIQNPNDQEIVVTRVTGSVTSVTSAGFAGRPICVIGWYSVGSFTGTRSIGKHGSSVVSVPISLSNLPSTNQDNCKGSTLHFSFTAQARQA